MSRAFFLIVAAGLAVGNAGCGLCCGGGGAKPGFTFAWQMPPTINQAAVLGPQVTSYAAQGLATGPTVGGLGLYSADVLPANIRTVERAPLPMPQRAPVQECTLDEICRMLQQIATRLDSIPGAGVQRRPRPSAMPMPKANPPPGEASDPCHEAEDL